MPKKSLQAYLLALVWAIVAIGFQVPNLLHHSAWQGERGTVMGHVDQIIEGRRITEIHYSYSVDGRNYTGEVDDASGFIEGTPETVTYAKSNPAVSTLIPGEINRLYLTSVIITILGLLPLCILAALSIRRRFLGHPSSS